MPKNYLDDGNLTEQSCDDCAKDTCLICRNFNRYATKKSLSQGLIDIALLTANASQLKSILTAGPQYRFYHLMLGLIVASIALQLIQASLLCVLGFSCNINKAKCHWRANFINNLVVLTTTCTTVINTIISLFDLQSSPRFLFQDP
ncbi:ninjurin-2-like [Culicoides brevitarsis]|uniref:ninjurin-2-like n=1 Tax=Culicoides brevitarsis TaxID=469753 RepID=UPI00307C1ED9